jgi:hypothetical protein
MDRQIVYPGSIPLDTDLLNVQRNTLLALGSLAKTILGNSPVVDGLACSPSSPGFAVTIGPGTVSVVMQLDDIAFGSLPADPASVVKTGVNAGYISLQLGTTPDQSTVLCWLIQATLTEQDDEPLTLQYWNANNPTVPFSGPGNSGSAQNTRRRMQLVLSAKSSAPVPVGTFAPPNPDPGSLGLYCVTTWVGKAGVTGDDIQVLPTAPLLPFHLPDLTPGFSRQDVIAADRTWQVPQGIRRIRVRVVGGGGGGGGGTTSFGGGGGGAGGYAEAILTVQPGQSFPVAVGVGGTPAPPTVTGGAGTASRFGDLVVAQGGLGGASSNPDSHGGTGGSAVAGAFLVQGGMGGDGPMVAGVPAGNGGASVFGGGGRGSNGGGSPADGRAPGSGAGGGYGNNASGGFGAAGVVIVEY